MGAMRSEARFAGRVVLAAAVGGFVVGGCAVAWAIVGTLEVTDRLRELLAGAAS